MSPDDRKYTAEHEWVRVDGDQGVIGVTDYAQDQLGDIVYVSLPEPGDTISPGASVGELESTKSVSDLFAPVSGVVTERNEQLDQTPELVNSDPYGEGWIVEIEVEDASVLDTLLDAESYRALLDEH